MENRVERKMTQPISSLMMDRPEWGRGAEEGRGAGKPASERRPLSSFPVSPCLLEPQRLHNQQASVLAQNEFPFFCGRSH